MNTAILTFAYHSIVALGLAGLIACLLLAGYGIILLYAWVLERYLVAKKLRELFREFMWQQSVHPGIPGKKEDAN